MELNLEARIQADFSGVVVREQGPIIMGMRYLLSLGPLRGFLKGMEMGFKYLKHLVRTEMQQENLDEVFSIYKGMPLSLLYDTADRLTLNPAFVEAVSEVRRQTGAERCIVDICTRDAEMLVKAYVESHGKELKEAGILIGSITGNALEYYDGILTGNADARVTLESKPSYLNQSIPYFSGKDECRFYNGLLENIQII